MKKYYIEYGNFANTYNLYWADKLNVGAVTENMERITRSEALEKAREERSRRQDDTAFSGYASACIYPVDYSENALHSPFFPDITGFIIERSDSEPLIMEYTSDAKRKEWMECLSAYELKMKEWEK